MASVPHNYMLGAFTYGAVAGENAAGLSPQTPTSPRSMPPTSQRERDRVLAPTRREDGIPPNQIEYKTRRLVNDYLQPPKVTAQVSRSAQQRLRRGARGHGKLDDRAQSARIDARAGGQSILDCAEMAAHASLYRTESRWGLYHLRTDYPEKDDENWFCHTQHRRTPEAASPIEARGRALYRADRRGRDVPVFWG